MGKTTDLIANSFQTPPGSSPACYFCFQSGQPRSDSFLPFVACGCEPFVRASVDPGSWGGTTCLIPASLTPTKRKWIRKPHPVLESL